MTPSGEAERPRLLVIGLDGVPPSLLFERFLPNLPNLRQLIADGAHGPLRTTDPPLSVPAWPVMFSGVDPGTLGLYGFRHRRAGSYTEMHIPTSNEVATPMLWHILSERGRRVAVLGVPPGYPPPSVNGVFISDFLTPNDSPVTTHPIALRAEIERRFGPYVFDVTFRSDEREQLAKDIFAMTRRRFEVAEWLYGQEPWDLFAVHEIGTDRLHHAYWKHFDPGHPGFQPGGPFEHIAEEYYTLVDGLIGRLLDRIDDRTYVVLASDHGSMAMRGLFCINQWLASAGYLALKAPSPPGTPIERAPVDWKKTRAWGAGGYYARIFFNLRGREPEGIVPLSDASRVRAELIADLGRIVGPDGAKLPVRVLDPREIYAAVNGEAPDLIVYFDELRFRAAGTIGHPTDFLDSNDTGPDDAVHSFDGVLVAAGPGIPAGRTLGERQIRDVLPTLLELLGEPVPSHVQGRPIPEITSDRVAAAPGEAVAGTVP